MRHAPRRQRASPSFRSGTAQAPPVARSGSARFRPRPGRTHQLSDRSTSLPRTAARTLSFRSDGQKLVRPDETGRAHRWQAAKTSPLRGSRRRTLATLRVRLMCNSREREADQNKNGRETASGQDQQYGARLRLSPKTTAIARATSSGQDVSNSRGDGQPSRHFAGCVCETGRPRWKNQIGPTPRRWASRPAVSAAHAPISRPSFRYAPASGSQ